MHERSLVQCLIKQIDEECATRRIDQFIGVRLEIGEFSGVEVALLSIAFEEMAALHWRRSVQLHVTRVPLTARCTKCQSEFFVEQFRFICPLCNHAIVKVIAGEELRLTSLIAARSEHIEGFVA
jgi:hydrogenase nickel incorporation protein HypA/HybF